MIDLEKSETFVAKVGSRTYLLRKRKDGYEFLQTEDCRECGKPDDVEGVFMPKSVVRDLAMALNKLGY